MLMQKSHYRTNTTYFFLRWFINTISTDDGVIFLLSATLNLHFHKNIYIEALNIPFSYMKLRIYLLYCKTDAPGKKSINWWTRGIVPKHPNGDDGYRSKMALSMKIIVPTSDTEKKTWMCWHHFYIFTSWKK